MDVSKAERKFDSKEYKISRRAYSAQCAFEYLVSILVTDAYLAKLLTDIGLSDSLIGIISSFVTGAFLFQIVTLFAVSRIKNVKRTSIIFSTASSLLFTCLYFIPFIPASESVRTVLVTAGILCAYFANYFITSVIYKWGNSFVDPSKRGSFSAGKEMISLIAGMVFTLAVGMIIDRYEDIGNIHGGFLFIAFSGLVLSACNFVCLILIKKDGENKKCESVNVFGAIKCILGNNSFRSVIVLTAIWNAGLYLTLGFLGTYKIKELGMTVGTVQIINIAANLCRVFASKPLGSYTDKRTFAKGIELAMCIAAAAFLINTFTSPKTYFLIIVFTVLYCVSTAGTNQNFLNIVYSYVPSEYFVHATAIKNCVGGIVGFVSSIIGSVLLSAFQDNDVSFFGIHIYGQQMLSLVSFVLIVSAVLYTKFVIEKQPVMKQ